MYAAEVRRSWNKQEIMNAKLLSVEAGGIMEASRQNAVRLVWRKEPNGGIFENRMTVLIQKQENVCLQLFSRSAIWEQFSSIAGWINFVKAKHILDETQNWN